MGKVYILVLALTSLAVAAVDAGCYRNGYKPPQRKEEDFYMNYVPAPTLASHKVR